MDQWESITILIMILMANDFGLSGLEGILILAIVLIMLGGLGFVRGLGESIRNFKAGVSRKQRQESSGSRSRVFLVIALTAVTILLSVLRLDGFSVEQMLVLTIVLLGWIGVGYWSFGRKLRKGNNR